MLSGFCQSEFGHKFELIPCSN